MNNLISTATAIPAPDASLAASYSPVLLPSPDEIRPVELRVTAPMTGDRLPVVLLSHGHGPSFYLPSKVGYGARRAAVLA